ncbi:hypothetical protein Tco_0819253 [Tanacetum coccineum]|uniref:Uncharacterized protein n=1 Tax=Tanacetum coccineum TaxID=301880 RepID=A0ABQ5A7S9_9ASTR
MTMEVLPEPTSNKLCGRPKDQGGLGLKNLQTWNHALLAKHVWNIAIKKDSLWVKWVHYVKLRRKSIWDVKEDSEDIWGWENLLKVRDQIRDNRLSKNLTVSNMIVNGRWRWPEEWFDKFPLITSLEVPNIEEGMEDKIDKLVTQDKLSKWGNQAVNSNIEKSSEYDRDQVFEYEWKAIINTLIKAGNGSSINSVVRRLIFAASVYNIWAERNRRIFQDRKMNDNDVFKRIVDVVKSKISGLIVKDNYAIKKIEDKYNI